MAVSENTVKVLEFLKANKDKDMTSQMVADALGLEKRTVDGCFTSGLCRKGLGERVLAEVENADGSHDKIKLLKLTEKGLTFDFNAEEQPAE